MPSALLIDVTGTNAQLLFCMKVSLNVHAYFPSTVLLSCLNVFSIDDDCTMPWDFFCSAFSLMISDSIMGNLHEKMVEMRDLRGNVISNDQQIILRAVDIIFRSHCCTNSMTNIVEILTNWNCALFHDTSPELFPQMKTKTVRIALMNEPRLRYP